MWRVTYQDDLDSGRACEQLCGSSAEASQFVWRLNRIGIPSNPMISRYSNIQVQDLDDTRFCRICRQVVSGNHECKPKPKAEPASKVSAKYIEMMTAGMSEPDEFDNGDSIRTPEEQAEIDADYALAEQEAAEEEEARIASYIEEEKKQRGGARPGAGRKPTPEAFDERSYQAGYKAGLRAAMAKLDDMKKDSPSASRGTLRDAIAEIDEMKA